MAVAGCIEYVIAATATKNCYYFKLPLKKKMEVLVFKTDVSSPKQASKVQSLLACFAIIDDINFDLEDCDNVLRIVASGLSPRHVELVLQGAGIGCQELEY